MKHKHVTTCEHEIKVCDCCDSAYCVKCEKEWGAQKPCTLNHYPTYWPVYPQPTYTPWWSNVPYGTYTVTNVCDSSMYTLTSGTLQ